MRPTANFNADTALEGTWSSFSLAFVEFADANLGAAEWSPRQVAVATCVALGVIRLAFQETYNVTWYSFVHGVISGYLSLLAVSISILAAVPLTGMAEPERSILCQGPLTSLHRIVPAITMGYGLFDIFDGFSHGIDFLLHGVATFTIMAYFCEYDLGEIIVPMLLMEISTPHLSVMRASFFSETGLAINMALFSFTFFLFRLVVCPYLWYEIVQTIHEHEHNPMSKACIPWHFKYVVLAFGTFFNGLNLFWGYKIVKKIQRKLKGIEKVNDSNDLKKDR